MPAVAILGDINVDLTLQIPAYPPEGGEGIAERQSHGLGGSGANTARILAGLGLPVHFIGKTGRDNWGDWCLAAMQREGVETRWVRRDEAEPTQLNVVVVSASGERTMFAYRGANAHLAAKEVDPAALAGTALLHLSGYALLQAPQREAALHALKLARAAGAAVSLDIPAGITGTIRALVLPLLPAIDILFLGEADARLLAGIGSDAVLDQAAERLVEAGTKQVVLKRGALGSLVHSRQPRVVSPAAQVEAIDTTGAGDAFAAGYIFGIVNGLAPAGASALANAAGAIAATTIGSGAGAVERQNLVAMIGNMDIEPALAAGIMALLEAGQD
ncbi:carbohydrate kinase family protein [Labrys sp. (in: a-proteobacteria)]|uniref:carbohydrate kinase family protein n=1 Tax=Labrys sp. (in: a-proteobacteria) TaxID=1917972 RepID=UPI0039E50264